MFVGRASERVNYSLRLTKSSRSISVILYLLSSDPRRTGLASSPSFASLLESRVCEKEWGNDETRTRDLCRDSSKCDDDSEWHQQPQV